MSKPRLIRRDDLPDTFDCVADGIVVGHITRSDRRWAHGWIVYTLDNRDIGDQPRRVDAVTALVAFVESPFRPMTSETTPTPGGPEPGPETNGSVTGVGASGAPRLDASALSLQERSDRNCRRCHQQPGKSIHAGTCCDCAERTFALYAPVAR